MAFKHFLLTYDLDPSYLERRGTYRAAHLGLAQRAVEAGDLVLGGALADPADRALLLFRGADDAAARAFAEADPYVENGLVTGWTVREWTTVIGPDAANKVS